MFTDCISPYLDIKVGAFWAATTGAHAHSATNDTAKNLCDLFNPPVLSSHIVSKDYINDQIRQQNQRIKSHHTLDHDTLKKYLEINNYTLMIIKEFNILGTNESYDYQTEIYNFNAECTSDEAILYFFPKENLNIMLNKEKMAYNSLIQLVEFRIKDIIWRIKDYIQVFEKKINNMQLKKYKNTLHLSNDNNKNNYNNENKLKITPIKHLSKTIYRKTERR